MPHLDKRTGEIVIRVVYDGAPEAGKTTNVRMLGEQVSLQRRGASASPGTTGRRTEFFDWLDFEGGFVDGKRVRCQVVSVPGQPSLLRRRRYLLRAADAVIFVADSSPELVDEARRSFTLLRRALERAGEGVPAGVLLQANKQDLAGALSPDALRAELDGQDDVPVVAARACEGEGVMQCFLMAVRLATERVRELILRGQLGESAGEEDTPESLLRAMLALEGDEPDVEVERRADAGGQVAAEDEAAAAVATVETSEEPIDRPRIPLASEIVAGHVWPPVQGRTILAAINAATVRASSEIAPWAPPAALEWRSEDGWVLHTGKGWWFADQASAVERLMTSIRAALADRERLPEGRALLIAPEAGDGWRLWMITPALRSLRELLWDALIAADIEALTAALTETSSAIRSVDDPDGTRTEFPGLGCLALQKGRVVSLRMPVDDGPESYVAPEWEIRALARRAIRHNEAAAACFLDATEKLEALGVGL